MFKSRFRINLSLIFPKCQSLNDSTSWLLIRSTFLIRCARFIPQHQCNMSFKRDPGFHNRKRHNTRPGYKHSRYAIHPTSWWQIFERIAHGIYTEQPLGNGESRTAHSWDEEWEKHGGRVGHPAALLCQEVRKEGKIL